MPSWFPSFLFFLAGTSTGVLSALVVGKSRRKKKRLKLRALKDRLTQTEGIFNTLHEGVIAIDDKACLIYCNRAAAALLELDPETALGQPIREVLPGSTLGRMLTQRVPEYSIPLVLGKNVRLLSDRVPIIEDDRITGAAAVLRSRSDADRLAEDLTGVRHMVDAMRAYTHEFLNKLHVILGLIQLGEAEKAEEYIMDVTSVHRSSVGAITHSIGNPSVAALLVGKTSRCNELGIHMTLRPESHLSADENLLPAEAYITILGNLIENAIDALNQTGGRQKDIAVSLIEDGGSLFICVEDTGPGMKPETARDIFKKGFSTKGPERGTGLVLVHEVTKAYQGSLRVESEPGVGTSFFINFDREPKKEIDSV